ncbi:MAG: hypothetical protein ACOX0H_02175 [Patescibacteria group bacterium]|jgi:hypothetical protein|nr:hypothetical protein [bacterium]HQC49957.1 hypothetical protein [bacterium]
MQLKDVTKNLKDQTDYRLDQRLDKMFRVNPRYKHLDAQDREIILDLLKKYKEKRRRGIKASRLSIKNDMYYLYHNRIKLGLTKNDLDDIRDLLLSLKE